MTRVGIIIGSTRPGRVGAQIAGWVHGRSTAADASVDLIDLAHVALPFLDEAEHPSSGRYANAHTQRWSRRIEQTRWCW